MEKGFRQALAGPSQIERPESCKQSHLPTGFHTRHLGSLLELTYDSAISMQSMPGALQRMKHTPNKHAQPVLQVNPGTSMRQIMAAVEETVASLGYSAHVPKSTLHRCSFAVEQMLFVLYETQFQPQLKRFSGRQ